MREKPRTKKYLREPLQIFFSIFVLNIYIRLRMAWTISWTLSGPPSSPPIISSFLSCKLVFLSKKSFFLDCSKIKLNLINLLLQLLYLFQINWIFYFYINRQKTYGLLMNRFLINCFKYIMSIFKKNMIMKVFFKCTILCLILLK